MNLILHIDGGARGNPGPAGAGVVLADESQRPVLEAGYFLGRMTNNAAEYTGLVRGIEAAQRAGVANLRIFSDSELLVKQINGEYRVKSPVLKDLYDTAFTALRKIGDWKISHVYRESNSRADELANMAMDAGEDVILVDEITGAGSAARKLPGKAPPAMIVTAICEVAPVITICPAPCAERTHYTFDRTVPEGLCIHAAHALLEAIHADHSPSQVACCQPGCNGVFKLS
jgi:ribonuclease HI